MCPRSGNRSHLGLVPRGALKTWVDTLAPFVCQPEAAMKIRLALSITLTLCTAIAFLAVRTAVILHDLHGFTWSHAWAYVLVGG